MLWGCILSLNTKLKYVTYIPHTLTLKIILYPALNNLVHETKFVHIEPSNLQDHTGIQKALNFGPFQISDFQIRDTQCI